MSLLSLCNSTADIHRSTNATDASSGITKTWTTVYTAIPISTHPATPKMREQRSRPEIAVNTVHYTPTAVSLRLGDRLVVGTTKYLIAESEDQAGRGKVFAIYSERIDQ